MCVDPSSPFSRGALLGDRIRMSQWYNHPDVYIRSLASKGSLGGLHPSIIEITDVVRSYDFDYIIIETVGVGQSEVEIAGLANISVVVLVPEAGDQVQTMKAGLMEIADIFVINKADRAGAAAFENHLQNMLQISGRQVRVVKTDAVSGTGVHELFEALTAGEKTSADDDIYASLLSEKAYHLIAGERMKDVSKQQLFASIKQALKAGRHFNLYKFVAEHSR